ncbi:MAG: hypothetical protein HC859_01595 [Bacteroidia bacterium]|nr:hypothetical protein [Bacteroidia bacterium]
MISKSKTLLLLCFLLLAIACDETTDDTEVIGNWTKVTPFKGARGLAR